MSVRFLVKRKVMRLRCLIGKHDFKMGAPAKTGGGFGCLWCGTAMRKPLTSHRRSWTATNAPVNVRKVEGEVDKP